jgi:hypothetical protein
MRVGNPAFLAASDAHHVFVHGPPCRTTRMGVCMRTIDDRIGLSAITATPGLGRAPAQRAKRQFKAPVLEFVVIALLVLLVVPTLILAARNQVQAERAQVMLSVTSDPSGASVIVDNLWVGRTPMQVDLTRGEPIALRVVAREPYLEYDLYKPYRAELTLEDNRNIRVWIPRTTAEEQAAQLADKN